jgi:hypothetical protein
VARALATPQPLLAIRRRFFFAGKRAMKNRVIARKRGVIPGCIPAGQDSHMAVDSLGRPWLEGAKLPSTVDAWLAALAKKSGDRKSSTGARRKAA